MLSSFSATLTHMGVHLADEIQYISILLDTVYIQDEMHTINNICSDKGFGVWQVFQKPIKYSQSYNYDLLSFKYTFKVTNCIIKVTFHNCKFKGTMRRYGSRAISMISLAVKS